MGQKRKKTIISEGFHEIFYRTFGFKWRHPLITASKVVFRGSCPKRVLGIWDFESGRAVYGDAIFFHEILRVLARLHGLDRIDCCFVNPAVRDLAKNPFQVTDSTTVWNIISLVRINPCLGSVFIFDDNRRFSDFFRNHKSRYVAFPHPLAPFATVSNLHHLVDFYDRYGEMPKLACDAEHARWGAGFLQDRCPGKVPFCVALRKNTRDPERNAPIAEWKAFFRRCSRKYPDFMFVAIGTKEEMHPELQGMDNILYAKQYNTTLLQDLALVQSSRAFLTHSSGLAPFAYFIENVPSLMFGIDDRYIHFGHAYRKGEAYNFAAEDHRFFWGRYSAEDIVQAFDRLVVRCGLQPGDGQ